jgi:purine-cytosine permease-like protein
MPVPVLTVAALLARAVTSILTRPTTLLVLLGWFAVSQFDFGVAVNQLQQSIAELWWLVVLILLTAICNTAIKGYIQTRRRGNQ